MSVSSKMFCTMQPLACAVSYSAHQAKCMGRGKTVAPWRLVTSCESHSTLLLCTYCMVPRWRLSYSAMVVRLQYVEKRRGRWRPREYIFGQIGPRWWRVSTANTRGATKILIKSLKPHNLIHLVAHNSSQIFKMILIVGITQACTVLRASPRVPYFVFPKTYCFPTPKKVLRWINKIISNNF